MPISWLAELEKDLPEALNPQLFHVEKTKKNTKICTNFKLFCMKFAFFSGEGHSLGTPGWWRSPAVEHRSLADVLSLSCARFVADG